MGKHKGKKGNELKKAKAAGLLSHTSLDEPVNETKYSEINKMTQRIFLQSQEGEERQILERLELAENEEHHNTFLELNERHNQEVIKEKALAAKRLAEMAAQMSLAKQREQTKTVPQIVQEMVKSASKLAEAAERRKAFEERNNAHIKRKMERERQYQANKRTVGFFVEKPESVSSETEEFVVIQPTVKR